MKDRTVYETRACQFKSRVYKLPLLAFAMSLTANSLAAPGPLSDEPLFLSTGVDPNILFLFDDSGSMNAETLLSNGAFSAHDDNDPGDSSLDFAPSGDDAAREARQLCAGYNVMAYNPNIRYTPWSGNGANINFANQPINAALNEPHVENETTNLTSHFYIKWNDDGDGVYELGECDTTGADSAGTRNTGGCPSCVFVADMEPEEQTNYANWYSFYRKRQFAAKRAISALIVRGGGRMGLAMLNGNGVNGVEIDDLDADLSNTDQQTQLLDTLFSIKAENGTPLRQTLNEAGKYFQVNSQSSELFGFEPQPNTPILPNDEGGACQQNFSILMSDGFWNGEFSGIGNTDGDNNSAFDGKSYADGFSDTLADIAMHYYETDLAPGLPNNVPISESVDTNTQQHMVTYTVAFGVNGTLQANPGNVDEPFAWPEPSDNAIETIDDMRHAAWNSRGQFLNAQDPEQLIASLTAAISDIQGRTGTASAAAFNSTTLRENTLVFQSSFDSGDWSGELSAFEFDENGVGSLVWRASDFLNKANFDVSLRAVYSFNEVEQQGVAFEFPSDYSEQIDGDQVTLPDSLSPKQIEDLLVNAPFPLNTQDSGEIADNQQFGEDIVDFIKGSFEFDSIRFRDRRGKRLGDIIHSGPVFVGAPKEFYPSSIEAVSYFDFVAENQNRTPAVYVGANDGMLHAFDARNGDELFAYIPNAVFSSQHNRGLHSLAELAYDHVAYVDASPISRDVFINGEWRTYLVGGLRTGGKAMFVLDVSDPSIYQNISAAKAQQLAVMEFTHEDMGFTFSTPQIAKMNNDKWAAIFGNGYNNDPSGDGEAKLFIVYLDGSGFEILETEAGSLVNADCNAPGSDCNGLSSPSLVDTNADFVVDRIYAGDLHGKLWAFDVSDSVSSRWSVAFGSQASPEPLFSACRSALINGECPADDRQPITTKPLTQAHPTVNAFTTEPNVLVTFGTGQFITRSDIQNVDLQSFYGVWDAGGSNGSIERDDLVEQEIIVPAQGNNNPFSVRQLTQNPVAYDPGPIARVMGWYIDLEVAGERISVDPTARTDLVFFSTTIAKADVCAAGGSGFFMAVDAATGGQPDRQVFRGINLGLGLQTIDPAAEKFAGFEIGATPGGAAMVGDGTVVVTDSEGRTNSIEFNPLLSNRNSRRSSWSILK